MEQIAQRAIATAGAAILLGADTPLLTPQHLQRAVAALSAHEAVIGPSSDGGYYLLGLQHCPTGLLAGLPWSTDETRCKTEERLHAHGYSVATLETLPDVDVLEDLLSLVLQLESAGERAPHTQEWIARNRDALRSLLVG